MNLALVMTIALAAAPAAADAPDLQRQVQEARDRVLPALVHLEPVLELYRGGQRSKQTITGSGVITSREGFIITNNHVVERAERVLCVLSNREEVPARVVGRDPLTDVAVLQIDMSEVQDLPPPATLGTSSDLQVGQIVLALGSPLGLARSLSMGVISSTDRFLPEDSLGGNRPVGSLNTWIQTDAAINPGNSGGPLVDLEGRVVGINARAIPIMGENLGFAIPADVVREVAEALIRDGRVTRSWLGVQWQHMKALEGHFGVDKQVGVLAGGIFPDGPAERAGLQAGDLIVSLDGEPVSVRFEEELPAFRKRITDLPLGSRVTLVVLRSGREEKFRLRTEQMPEVETDEMELAAWGFTVRDLTREMARRMRLDDEEGALVTGVKPDGPAYEAGLRQFDVVRKLGKRAVPSSQELQERYENLLGKKPESVYMEARRGRTTRFLLIEPVYD